MGVWKKMPKYSIIKIDLYHWNNDFFVEASKKMKKLIIAILKMKNVII